MIKWSLKRVVDPIGEPVTVDQLKLNLHITYSQQDTTLSSYLKAARVQAEDYQRRSYITQTWELVLDEFPPCEILLLRGPVQSLESVTVTDIDGNETVMDLGDFIVLTDNTPARMVLKDSASWPSVTLQKIGGIRIRYTAGFGTTSDVPEDVKHAIILFASFADDNRATEDDMLPASFKDLLKNDRIYTDTPFG